MNNEAEELIKQLRAMQLQFKEIVNSFERLIRHPPKSCLLCYIIGSDNRGPSRGNTHVPGLLQLSGFASLTVLRRLVRVVLMLLWVLATGSTHSECFLEADKIGQAAEFLPFKLPVGMQK